MRAFLEQRPDAYRTDERPPFVHVFLSAERRGDAVAQDAPRLPARLRSSQQAVDPAALTVITLARRFPVALPAWSWRNPPCAIGGVASFWLIQRLAAFGP